VLFPVTRQSLKLVAELLQLHRMLTAVTLGPLQLCSRLPLYRCHRFSVLFSVTRQSLRLVAELLQLHWTLTAVTLGPSQLQTRLTLHRYRHCPVLLSVTQQSPRLVIELLQLHWTLTAVTLDSSHLRSRSLFLHYQRLPTLFQVIRQSLRLVIELLQFKLPGSQLCRMMHLPIWKVCRKPFKTSGWLKVHYKKEHPGFLDMNNHHDGDAYPNPYEHHITGWPPFYNRDDPVLPNFLEDGDPVIATWDDDVHFFPTDTIRCASPRDAVPITEITNMYPHTGLPIHYVPDLTEMLYVREQNDLISNRDDPAYAYHPFQNERFFKFVNWYLSNNITQTAADQLLKGQYSLLGESV